MVQAGSAEVQGCGKLGYWRWNGGKGTSRRIELDGGGEKGEEGRRRLDLGYIDVGKTSG
jgi:hypothetical protein